MRHLVRLAMTGLVGLTAASVLAAQPVSATPVTGASSAAASASVIALHGLGARTSAATVATANTSGVARSSAATVLPASVDLTRWAMTPANQGASNSCVTWTIDYGMLGWYSRFTGLAGQPFAPMYAYSQINGGGDWGSDPVVALQLAVAQGNDTRAHYVQGDTNWKTAPTNAERVNAARFKIKGFSVLFAVANRAANTTALKQALATNHPVAITIAVRHGFDTLAAGKAATDTDTTSTIRGNHEVLALGYDAAGLIIENSWGTGWANGGFGRISWAVVQRDVSQAETMTGFVQAASPPTVSTPVAARIAVVAAAHTSRYVVAWRATPGNTGAITTSSAWYQIDGGPLVAVKLTSPTATSFNLVTQVGHTYRIAVRATAGTSAGVIRYGAQFVA